MSQTPNQRPNTQSHGSMETTCEKGGHRGHEKIEIITNLKLKITQITDTFAPIIDDFSKFLSRETVDKMDVMLIKI